MSCVKERISDRFPRKSLYAGKVEAAGIEPACESPPNLVKSDKRKTSECVYFVEGA